MNVLDDIKKTFKNGSALTKLIYINTAVFVLMKLIFVVYFLANSNGLSLKQLEYLFSEQVLYKISVSADPIMLLKQPWGIITYMFLHFSLSHIFFNMLALYIFGKIFLRYLDNKKLLGTYILGGFAGALLYIIAFKTFPGLKIFSSNGYMLGASAGVMSIMALISFYIPNHTITIPLIRIPIKLKYIAIIFIVLDVLQLASSNSGGHFAHLGGALFGFLYASSLKKGKDFSRGFNNMTSSIFSVFAKRKKFRVTHKRPMSDMQYNSHKATQQERVNKILEKIKKSGYDSLSKEEKDILFRESNKN